MRSLLAVAGGALLSATAAPTTGFIGVDVSTPVSSASARCMRASNVSFAVARAWHSYGGFDSAAPGTVAAWQAAGINASVYLFPCALGSGPSPRYSADEQVGWVMGNLTASGTKVERVWLDIEENTSPGCEWSSTDLAANCAFYTSLIDSLTSRAIPWGVYASIHEFTLLLSKDPAGCAVGNAGPLWYPHYEQPVQPSFADFSPFGGWTTPTTKQYDDHAPNGQSSLCGVGVDSNWAPTVPH
jgi:hypothetical protein